MCNITYQTYAQHTAKRVKNVGLEIIGICDKGNYVKFYYIHGAKK